MNSKLTFKNYLKSLSLREIGDKGTNGEVSFEVLNGSWSVVFDKMERDFKNGKLQRLL